MHSLEADARHDSVALVERAVDAEVPADSLPRSLMRSGGAQVALLIQTCTCWKRTHPVLIVLAIPDASLMHSLKQTLAESSDARWALCDAEVLAPVPDSLALVDTHDMEMLLAGFTGTG